MTRQEFVGCGRTIHLIVDSHPGVTVASPDASNRWDLVASSDLARPEVGSREVTFRCLYDAEYRLLAAYCWRLTRDTEVSADIAQEAFTRLLARWIAVREPRAYVYQVATNLVRRQWRHQSRYSEVSVPETMSVVATEEDGLDVRLAVARLPRRLRDVVLLHYYADLSVTDVAVAVQRPVGTVKRQLSEARTILSAGLELSDV
jgi:RNA polymerase sigma-70 factor (ECF subfamily)